MDRYFFDFRDDGVLSVDEEGVELPNLEAAKLEAVKALAGYAGQVIVGPDAAHEIVVEIRHHNGPLFRTQINFETENLKDGDD